MIRGSDRRFRRYIINVINIIIMKSKFGRRAFSVAGSTAWNSLPDYLRDPSLSELLGDHWRHFVCVVLEHVGIRGVCVMCFYKFSTCLLTYNVHHMYDTVFIQVGNSSPSQKDRMGLELLLWLVVHSFMIPLRFVCFDCAWEITTTGIADLLFS